MVGGRKKENVKEGVRRRERGVGREVERGKGEGGGG